jgi:hypothetical protein
MRADEVRPLLNRFTPLPTFFAISASDATKPRRRYRKSWRPRRGYLARTYLRAHIESVLALPAGP